MFATKNHINITITKDRIKFHKEGSNDFFWVDNSISNKRIAIMSVADASRFFKEVFKEHYDSFFSPSIRLTLDIDYEGGLKDLELQGFKLALSNAGAKKILISGRKS